MIVDGSRVSTCPPFVLRGGTHKIGRLEAGHQYVKLLSGDPVTPSNGLEL